LGDIPAVAARRGGVFPAEYAVLIAVEPSIGVLVAVQIAPKENWRAGVGGQVALLEVLPRDLPDLLGDLRDFDFELLDLARGDGEMIFSGGQLPGQG